MTAVQELTRRLQDLPEKEREIVATALLKAWDEQAWDRQIANDLEEGKLDFLIEEVTADIEAGRVKPL